MKNLKKILAMTLVCVMLLAVLAACGAKEQLIIGITDYFPMNYKDDNGKWTGFETDFAREVCKILGFEAEFTEIDWGSKEVEVNAGNIDAVWNGMTANPERAESMDLSTRYMRNRQVMVVRADDADKYSSADGLAGASIVAEDGSAGLELAETDAFFSAGNITPVDGQIKAVLEVKSLTADIAVIDYVMAGNLLKKGTDYAGLVMIDLDFEEEEFAIALRKNSDGDENAKITLKELNDAIKKLTDNGKLQEIADKYGLGDLIIK